jgi:hypothetical protein
MRHLRKPTESYRATVDLQAREIVSAELQAPPGAIRRVRLLVPPGPRCAFSIDRPTPDEAGPGRAFLFVNLPTDIVMPIYLQAHQTINALTVPGTGGMVELGVVIEYFDEES